jgi:tetratricopeptide (TPR) repeat protein
MVCDVFDFRGAKGVQIGNQNSQTNIIYPDTTRAVVEPLVAGGSGDFVGRESEIQEVFGPPGAAVTVLAGLAGAGKTALARAAAARAVMHGEFPGGAFLIDMRGYGPDDARVGPAHVFAPFLRAAGTVEPAGPVDEQAAQYHRFLAECDKPMLLVLDNVAATEQVAELIPHGSAHRVLITSRHLLGDLPGMRVRELHEMSPAEAVTVLEMVLRRRAPADSRVRDEPGAAAEVARLCGYLPLALHIVAEVLADNRTRPVAEVARRLAEPGERLNELAYGDQPGIRAAFDLSWENLVSRHPEAARLFALLSLHPGEDLSASSATALAGAAGAEVLRWLDEMRRSHVVQTGRSAGRYQFHDLMRLYADYRCASDISPDEQDAAVGRLIDDYENALSEATRQFEDMPTSTGRFAGRDQALDWLEAEMAGLVPVVKLAAEKGHLRATGNLAFDLRLYADFTGNYRDLLDVSVLAVDAARRLNEPEAEALLLNSVGISLRELGRVDQAVAAHERSLSLFRAAANLDGEGVALGNLGLAYTAAGRPRDAEAAQRRSLEISRRLGHRTDEVLSLISLAEAESRPAEAISLMRRALRVARDGAGPDMEVHALLALGKALGETGTYAEAADLLTSAEDIARRRRDDRRTADAAGSLGIVAEERRSWAEAAGHYERELVIRRRLGDPVAIGMTLGAIASTRQELARYAEAVALYGESAALFEAAGDLKNLGHTHAMVGLTHDEAGDPAAAQHAWRAALTAFEAAGAQENVTMVRQLLDREQG